MNCGVGHRHSSDPTLLWLWDRPAIVALIQPLAWELAYADGVALKRKEKKKKKQCVRILVLAFPISWMVFTFEVNWLCLIIN